MPKRPLWWHLLPSYLLLAAIALVAIGWLAINRIDRSLVDAKRADLLSRADFLERQFDLSGESADADFARLCRAFSQTSDVRVMVLSATGQPDSAAPDSNEPLDDPLSRREIRQALGGVAADDTRYNPALDQWVLYVAAPVFRDDKLVRVLYFSTPLAFMDRARSQVFGALAGVAALLAIAAALFSLRAARGVTASLETVRDTADRLAEGAWAARAAVPDAREPADLAERINRMADRVQQRIRTLTQNNNEQKAVLASMAEGVLAVDNQERVISVNAACSRSLGIDPAQAQGRPLREVVRNADLTRFITRALASDVPIEADILLHDRQRTMQAHGSALHDLENRPIGVVVVLNDVTAFRRLEHIRRDFVANVSHELKTPITSIKGFVETLLDGAMQEPEDSRRFLQIVGKQADRLHAIIEDLLSLSKIEQSEEEEISLERRPLRSVIESAVNVCQTLARDHDIDVVIECDELQANINGVLLEQAVVNLLDNAIKYSEPGREVQIAARKSTHEIMLSVTDRGCGIGSQHLARIFERFYRVDRARSRKLGGTGLGLAIVKHIAQAHHGRVEVESTLGVGSTFTIVLPNNH